VGAAAAAVGSAAAGAAVGLAAGVAAPHAARIALSIAEPPVKALALRKLRREICLREVMSSTLSVIDAKRHGRDPHSGVSVRRAWADAGGGLVVARR
jgi:hypothetical protein